MLSCWFSSFQWIQDFVYKTFFNWWYSKVFASTLWRTSCKQATTPHLWSSSFCRVPEILCSKCLLLANFVFDKNVLKHVILIWSHESPDCNTIFFFKINFSLYVYPNPRQTESNYGMCCTLIFSLIESIIKCFLKTKLVSKNKNTV